MNRLIKETGAKLVISSSWRLLFDMETLSDFFVSQKIVGEIIDYTSRFGGERGHEIQYWLNDHPEVEKFVILDDGTDMAHLGDYLVNTTWESGLEESDVDKAIEILNSV